MLFLLSGLVAAQQGPSPLVGKTIHVYNPRPGDSLFVDMSGQGFAMTPVAGTNWMTFTVPATIQNHIVKFGVRNAYGQNSFWISRTGVAAGGSDAFDTTDFKAGNALWIVIDPAGPATAAPTTLNEAPKVVYVYNPWPLTAPAMSLAGGVRKPMLTVPNNCGWFWALLLKPAEQSFFLEEVNGTDAYGSGGLRSRVPYDMAAVFTQKGASTLWLDSDNNTWLTADPKKTQPCGYKMAATVRDFSLAHPDFDFDGITGDMMAPGMLQETLGPNRKPVRTAKTSPHFNKFEEWFNTTPGANAETCVDLPMSKSDDGLWLYDSFDTPEHGFWPIDSFTTYNGAPNPYNQMTKKSCYVRPIDGQWITDQPPHNMNYCMESHATFVYQPGQKFEFRGDDDVWVYIDNKLQIDLGGLHVPKADTIELDKLSLVPGKTYNWDFFYCERQPCGTSLRIKTSIYFRQQRALEAKEDSTKPGTFKIVKYSGGTGACGSIGDEVKEVPVTSLIYKLLDAAGKEEPLGEGSFHNGGIVIATPSVVVDVTKIKLLPPGNYRVVAYEAASPTIKAEVPFTIINRSWVQFEPKEVAVTAGTLVQVVAANRLDSDPPTGALSYTFTVQPSTGLKIFGDQAVTIPVANSGSTGADGLDTLWVGVDPEIAAPVTYILATAGSNRQVKVTFNPKPLDLPLVSSASIHDADADGIADSIVVVYDRDISARLPKQVAYQWPASAAPTATPGAALAGLVAGTTLTLSGKPLGTAVLTAGEGRFHSTYPARGSDSNQVVPLADRIAPVLIKAEMLPGAAGDTLRLSFSEPIKTEGLAAPAELFVYRQNQAGADQHYTPAELRWNAARDGADLIFPAGSSESPRSGNLVRIMDGTGRIADAAGNGAGPKSRFRLITGTKRADVATVTYIKVDPTLALANRTPLVTTLEASNAKVDDVVARTGRLGHLIKVDLGDYAQADDFNPVNPAQVALEYQVGYFTNHGQPIVSEKRTISCLDPIFKGDCRTNRGFLFVGWNFNTLKDQRVATGAYVASIRFMVRVAGKTLVAPNKKDEVWGVLRTN